MIYVQKKGTLLIIYFRKQKVLLNIRNTKKYVN